ncbi:MAG: aminotransferase class I/II-fold pyridoxal phosphate-dependent enzyme [Clostridiales bacterium]|jgi:threonine aldolase|nr:aminotransferase class I/II-fold pyridoxal phosphate-dependent enzyme [Clostridiales bacterium]
MIYFQNDYSEGCHPEILAGLNEINSGVYTGYGYDYLTEKTTSLLKNEIKNENIDIHYLGAGTLTNLTAISAFLKPYEAIISSSIGHINTHETGAIEATGHRVVEVFSDDNKLNPDSVEKTYLLHTDEHMVKPKLVYISNSTEAGQIYTKSELVGLRGICDKYGLYLYIDGARMGAALTCAPNDLTLYDISKLADAFYIGGTKNGILFGETLIICNDGLKPFFRYNMKQRGAVIAKTWVVSGQFYYLFKSGLFYGLSKYANNLAQEIYTSLKDFGVDFYSSSPTNQLFPIFHNNVIEKLSGRYLFNEWAVVDKTHTAIRLVTSWATKKEDALKLVGDIKRYHKTV